MLIVINQGSITRPNLWEDWSRNKLVNLTIERNKDMHPTLMKYKKGFDMLVGTRYANESQMYSPATDLLSKVLGPDFYVHDGHAEPLINTLKPDLAIFYGTKIPMTDYMATFIELKSPKTKLTNEHQGQALDYLLGLRKRQPHRANFFGLLSNTRETYFFLLNFKSSRSNKLPDSGVFNYTPSLERRACSFSIGITLLINHLTDPNNKLSIDSPKFPHEVGKFVRILGVPDRSAVGQFLVNIGPGSTPVSVAVKVPKASKDNEHILKEKNILRISQSLGCHHCRS